MNLPKNILRYISEQSDRTLLCEVALSGGPFEQGDVYRACFMLGRICERVGVRMRWRTVKIRSSVYLILVLPTPEDAFAVRIGSSLKLVPAQEILELTSV